MGDFAYQVIDPYALAFIGMARVPDPTQSYRLSDLQVISVDIRYHPAVGADHASLRQEDLINWRLYEFPTTTDWQRVVAPLN